MNFSKRNNHKRPEHNPLESMSFKLKNDIWTEIYKHINTNFIRWGSAGLYSHEYRDDKATELWTKFFASSISNLPPPERFLSEVESKYKNLEWNEVYDLIEFLLPQTHRLPEQFNEILDENNAAYRIINWIVQPISDKQTIQAVENAKENAFNAEAKKHLEKAQILYSDRKLPDYSNSCLESIKSVEATLRFIFKNENILSENIKVLKKNRDHNQHMLAILTNLGAFRGNDVAHAEKPNDYVVTREDALLIHTICCGIINYFKSRLDSNNN